MPLSDIDITPKVTFRHIIFSIISFQLILIIYATPLPLLLAISLDIDYGLVFAATPASLMPLLDIGAFIFTHITIIISDSDYLD